MGDDLQRGPKVIVAIILVIMFIMILGIIIFRLLG